MEVCQPERWADGTVVAGVRPEQAPNDQPLADFIDIAKGWARTRAATARIEGVSSGSQTNRHQPILPPAR